MRYAATLLTLLLAFGGSTLAQTQAQKNAAQQAAKSGPESMTCPQILAISSSEYIARFTAIDDSSEDGQLRGIKRYGTCYDARTDALAASLGRSGKGPLMGARGDFRDFEAALKDFTTKALAIAQTNSQVPLEIRKGAYADLYEKQFRYMFYQEYETRPVKTTKPAAPATKTSSATAPTPPTGTPHTAPTPATPQEQARSNADPVTMAKNRFGKLLESLPDDKMHELHEAFGNVIGPFQISEATRLAAYRYAIFILEPPSDAPFSPPPF